MSDFATTFVLAFQDLLHGMAGATRSFQISTCVVEKFFIFLVVKIKRVNQSLSVFEHCRTLVFLVPIPVFSILSGRTNLRPNFWTYVIWSGSCFESLSVFTRTTHKLYEGLSSKRVSFF